MTKKRWSQCDEELIVMDNKSIAKRTVQVHRQHLFYSIAANVLHCLTSTL